MDRDPRISQRLTTGGCGESPSGSSPPPAGSTNRRKQCSLQTEGRVTLVDAYLAAAVLIGLTLNAALGWWWADPLPGLVVVYCAVRESALYHEHSPDRPA